MNCREFKDVAAAYALDALDEEERRDAAEHLKEPSHEGCHAALAQAYRVTASLSVMIEEAPIAAVAHERAWTKIVQRIRGATDSDASHGKVTRLQFAPREFAAWTLVAAAVVALYLFSGRVRKLDERASQAERALVDAKAAASERDACNALLQELQSKRAADARLLALLAEPGSRVIAVEPLPGKGYSARAVVDRTASKMLIVSRMPSEPGKDFQLWVLHGKDAPKAAGFMRATGDGALSIGEVNGEALRGGMDAIGISREALGGAAAPTEVIAVGKPSG